MEIAVYEAITFFLEIMVLMLAIYDNRLCLLYAWGLK